MGFRAAGGMKRKEARMSPSEVFETKQFVPENTSLYILGLLLTTFTPSPPNQQHETRILGFLHKTRREGLG